MKHLKPSALLRMAALLLVSFSLHQCVVPYETARMLPKGETEIKAAFTHVRASFEGETEKADNGLGIGIGYGINEKVNIKFRYENLRNDDEGSANFISFGPKFALKQDRIAAALPIGMFFDEGESEWFISPMFLFTIPNAVNTFETTLGLRADKFFEEDTDLLIGVNIGFGFSIDLSRWAFRPDFGIVFNPGESGSFLSFGAAFNYNIEPGGGRK